jgi:ABC-2 type transport system permease protein
MTNTRINESLIAQIAGKEYRSLRNSPQLFWSGVVLSALFAVALTGGVRYYRYTTAAYAAAKAKTYEQWLNQGDKSPHSAAHYGLYAFKPLPGLSVLDKGMDAYLGTAVWLEAHNQNEVRWRPVQDAGVFARADVLTVAWLWQFILPLVVILLSFGSVSGEREAGTLRMLLGTSASGKTVVFGKWAGICRVVLQWLFLPMWIAGAAGIWLAAGGVALIAALPGLLALGVLHALHLALWSGIGVLFSAWWRSSNASLTALLGFWAAGVFLVPRFSGTLARQLHPTPSSAEFTESVLQEREKGADGTGSYAQFQEDLQEKTLRTYGVDSLTQLPVSFAGIALQAGEDRDWAVYDKYYGGIFDIFLRQDQVLEYCYFASPALAVQSVSRGLAGTDLHQHMSFTQQAEAHRRMVQQLMNNDQTRNGAGQERGYKASSELWRQAPDFVCQPLSLGTQLSLHARGLAALLFWLMLVIIAFRVLRFKF